MYLHMHVKGQKGIVSVIWRWALAVALLLAMLWFANLTLFNW
jgi:hypothetical protein